MRISTGACWSFLQPTYGISKKHRAVGAVRTENRTVSASTVCWIWCDIKLRIL